MLPKIYKTTNLARQKLNDRQLKCDTKVLLNEIGELEKRKQMAIVIHDYLDNFRTRQKGTILAFSNQNSRI